MRILSAWKRRTLHTALEAMQLLQNTHRGLRISMEAETDPSSYLEIEHVFYAKVEDLSELKKAASSELQEQWEIKIPKTETNAGEGGIRVRKTAIAGADPVYTLTTKVKKGDDGDKFEVEVPSNKDQFDQFRFLSDRGMIKERFYFPVTGTKLVYEVDMFLKPEGGYHEYCKIDLEVTDRDAQIPPFPIELTDVIFPKGYGRQNEEESERLISELYETCFITGNQFLAAVKTGVAISNDEELATGEEAGAAKPGEVEPTPLPGTETEEKPESSTEETPPAEGDDSESDPEASAGGEGTDE